jgi:hypothetical protein
VHGGGEPAQGPQTIDLLQKELPDPATPENLLATAARLRRSGEPAAAITGTLLETAIAQRLVAEVSADRLPPPPTPFNRSRPRQANQAGKNAHRTGDGSEKLRAGHLFSGQTVVCTQNRQICAYRSRRRHAQSVAPKAATGTLGPGQR